MLITAEQFNERKSQLLKAVFPALTEEIMGSEHPDRDIMLSSAADNAKEIVNLIEAIANNRGIFLVCEQEPEGCLEDGGSSYTLHYITKDCQQERFFLSNKTMEIFGAELNSNGNDWFFTSDAIGKSRNFEALQYLARFLEELKIGTHQEMLNAIAKNVL